MVPEQQSAPSATSRRFVAFTLAHGRLLWLIAAVLAIPAAWRTVGVYSNLRSDIEELLPRDAPSVRAIDELRRRMPGLQHLGMVVEAPHPEALPQAERFLDDLAARIRRYPPDMVKEVRTGVGPERRFVEDRLPLFVELEDLTTVRERVEDRVRWEYSKSMGTLLDESDPPPAIDFSDIEQKYRSQLASGKTDGDRFTSRELGTTLLLVEVGGFSTGASKAEALLKKVRSDIAALGGPAAYAPGLKLGFTGDVAVSAEEMEALVADLTLSSLLVVLAVVLALIIYYRWRRSVPALFLPLALGALFAFALASLPPFGITELNSNTAFMGSIIVGNGINFGIILLARYVEARRRGHVVQEALVTAVSGTFVGTLSAALAAGAAYASLVAMQFRGFRQFGVIGGLGMVLCWGVTFLLAPPLIAWLDRGRIKPEDQAAHPRLWHPMSLLATAVTRRPKIFIAVATVATLAAGFQVRHFGRDQLEYDFSRLRRRDTWTQGEGLWGRKMDALLGRYLTPTVILTDDPAHARAIAERLRAAMKTAPLDRLVASIRTADDLVPADQPAKVAHVEAIRKKLTSAVRAQLDDATARKLDRFLGPEGLRPFARADVPEALTKGLRERDGTLGQAVLIFPRPSKALWQGPTMATFVNELRAIAAAETPPPGAQPARVAGGPPLTADIIESMERDGPLASGLALAGVIAAVLLLFRRSLATPFVIGALLLGVLWLIALAMLFGVKINFVNFIAFPITFGIGVDYAVNVMGRYIRDGHGDVADAIRGTGGAVGLCSLTTIIGYSSLLVAQNVGLFLFGLLAVLGELTCLTAAVVVLPAVLLMVVRRRRHVVAIPQMPPIPHTNGVNGVPKKAAAGREIRP